MISFSWVILLVKGAVISSFVKYFLNSFIFISLLLAGVESTTAVTQIQSEEKLNNQTNIDSSLKSNIDLLEETTIESEEDSTILINEIMFNPGEGEYEWIELKNIGPDLIDISGYCSAVEKLDIAIREYYTAMEV